MMNFFLKDSDINPMTIHWNKFRSDNFKFHNSLLYIVQFQTRIYLAHSQMKKQVSLWICIFFKRKFQHNIH